MEKKVSSTSHILFWAVFEIIFGMHIENMYLLTVWKYDYRWNLLLRVNIKLKYLLRFGTIGFLKLEQDTCVVSALTTVKNW